MHTHIYIYIYIYIYPTCPILPPSEIDSGAALGVFLQARRGNNYTRSPLEDSRLFGPSPWKI